MFFTIKFIKISSYLVFCGFFAWRTVYSARTRIFHTGVRFRYGIMSFSPEKMFKNYICWVRWQIQSAFHEKSTFSLGLARNGCIKP